MKKAVIYARQSSGSDDFSESVENQILNCQKLAKKENLEVVGIFQDLNTSGKTYPKGGELIAENDIAFNNWFNQQTKSKKFREGLGKAFEMLSTIDFIIVDDMTRLYRPVTRSFLESYINQSLTNNNVSVLQVKGGKIDLSNFDAVLIQTLKNQIQDEAIANQKKKSMQQLAKRRNSGMYANGTGKALGTVYDKNTGKITFNSEYTELIQFVFDSVCNYVPAVQILKVLNTKYIHLAIGKLFYQTNFYHIVKNPVYCGYMFDGEKNLIKNIQIEGSIISFEQFQRANKILLDNKKNQSKAKKNWLPFSGMLYCGTCGGRLSVRNDEKRIVYECRAGAYYKSDSGCKSSKVTINIEKDFYVGLEKAIKPLLVLAYIDRLNKYINTERDCENLDELKVALENMLNKKKALSGMFLKGLITEEELETSLYQFNMEMDALKSRINLAETRQKEQTEVQKHLNNTFLKIKAFNIDDISNTEYESLLKEVVNRIECFKDYITIKTIYGDINLPRYIYKNKKHFPTWEMSIGGRSFETLEINLHYFSGKKQGLIADFNKLKIYSN